jgi:ribose-phosphate pyrophosphokinase
MTAASPRKLLFTIASYAYLEQAFVEAGNFDRGRVERKTFPDGEKYLRLADDPWGRDVVLLGGTPADSDYLEVYDLGCAVTRAGARSLSIVMPYFGYSTMERATRPGEVVTAKNRARLLSTIPRCDAGTRLLLFDLHTDGIEFYFGDALVTHHLGGFSLVGEAIRKAMPDASFVVGATDAGRAKWVQVLARELGATPAFVYKERDPQSGEPSVSGVNADVRGREVVIYDDMIRTGSSLIQAARAYVAAGARRVHAIASHLVLPGTSLETLEKTELFASIRGTDSHPGSQKLRASPDAIQSVVPLFVKALERS